MNLGTCCVPDGSSVDRDSGREWERCGGERALESERSGSSPLACLLPLKGAEKLEVDEPEDERDTRSERGGGLAYRGRDSDGF